MFPRFWKKRFLINSFILSNFSYCPLVWSISSANSLLKVENLQKWTLRFLQNDYSISYELSKKSGKLLLMFTNIVLSAWKVSKYGVFSGPCIWTLLTQCLCFENFKTLNDINPSFVKEIFRLQITNLSTREK